jgi:hypothetical protein
MRYTTQLPDGTGMNLTKRMAARKLRNTDTPSGWTKHTPFHWSRSVNGHRLDFWPTKDKWAYGGKTYFGDVDRFIEKEETK